MMNEERPSRNLTLDLLRGVAALGIVGCHLALAPLTHNATLARSLCDMNVCLFAALSGYFLFWGKTREGLPEESFSHYFVRRGLRLLPVYAFWTIVYLALGMVFDFVFQGGLDPKRLTGIFYVKALFLGDSATHLWFVICLFYSQILLKALTLSVGRKSGCLWIGMGLLLIALSAMSSGWCARYPIRLGGALIAGYGLSQMPVMVFERKMFANVFASLALLLLGVACHYVLSGIVHVFIRDWVLALIVLRIASNVNLPRRLWGMADFAGKTSLGVFCVHPLFAAILGLLIRRVFPSPYGCFPLFLDWGSIWLASIVMTCLLLRLPHVNRMVK